MLQLAPFSAYQLWLVSIVIRQNSSSASDSAYSYTVIRSVVCLLSVTFVYPA